jgi:anti-anti-sigma factor
MSVRDVLYAACSFALPVPGTGLLRITGELDAYSAELIEQQVRQNLAPGFDRLVLDLTGLEFIDSTGIRLLLHVITQRQHPSDIVVLSPQAITARRALEIVGFTRVIRTADSLDEALATPPPPASDLPTLRAT